MTTTVSKKFIEFAKQEIMSVVMELTRTIDEFEASKIADDVLSVIDWTNSALMHKGFFSITERYLIKNKRGEK